MLHLTTDDGRVAVETVHLDNIKRIIELEETIGAIEARNKKLDAGRDERRKTLSTNYRHLRNVTYFTLGLCVAFIGTVSVAVHMSMPDLDLPDSFTYM